MAPQAPWRWTPKKIDEMAESLLKFMEDPEHVFFKEWAVEQHIPASHVTRFAEMSERFAEALELANDVQETRLVRGGLRETYNHNIVKLLLSSKFGYVEQSGLAVTATPTRPRPNSIEECDKLIGEIQTQRIALENMITEAGSLESAIV